MALIASLTNNDYTTEVHQHSDGTFSVLERQLNADQTWSLSRVKDDLPTLSAAMRLVVLGWKAEYEEDSFTLMEQQLTAE